MQALEAFRQALQDGNDSEDFDLEEHKSSEEDDMDLPEDGRITDQDSDDSELPRGFIPRGSKEKKEPNRPRTLLKQSEEYAKRTRQRIEQAQDLTDVKNVYLQQRLQSTSVSMDEYNRGKEISKAFFEHNSKYIDEPSKSKSIWTQGAVEILHQEINPTTKKVTRYSFQKQFAIYLDEKKGPSELTQEQKLYKRSQMDYLKATGHSAKFKIHQPTKLQVFVTNWRHSANLELTDMRRQLILKLAMQREKLAEVRKLSHRKLTVAQRKIRLTKKIDLIVNQLHNLEILTSKYDEILLNGTRKADANSRYTPLQIMNSIWEANQLAGFIPDYEKYNEFTKVQAVTTDKHPLNEEILTTWSNQDRISALNANPQIADNTSRALLNPKSTPKGLVALQKKRKFKGNHNRNNKRKKTRTNNGGKPYHRKTNNHTRNNYNRNRQNGNQNKGGQKTNTKRGTNNLRPDQTNNNPFFKCPIHNKLAKNCKPYCTNNPRYDKTKHKSKTN